MAISTKNAASKATQQGFIGTLLGFHMRLAQLRLFSAFSVAVADQTLTPLLAGALYLIAENPGTNQTDLAALLVTDPSTMVRLIDQLVKRGWVERKTLTRDRRNTVPRATAAGKAIVAKLAPLIRASEDTVAADLSENERQTLITLLRRLK
jgi:DNA-binding MarR family transcriptional regulator